MELVSTASQWFKKYSTYFIGLLGLLPAINLYLPVLQLVLSPWVYALIVATIGALGIYATQVKQPSLHPADPPVVDTIVTSSTKVD